MHNLYYSFKEGWEGQEENVKTAFEWLQRAAEGGHDIAMHDMGVVLYRGEHGQAKNLTKAAEWWAKAGEKVQWRMASLLTQARAIIHVIKNQSAFPSFPFHTGNGKFFAQSWLDAHGWGAWPTSKYARSNQTFGESWRPRLSHFPDSFSKTGKDESRWRYGKSQKISEEGQETEFFKAGERITR